MPNSRSNGARAAPVPRSVSARVLADGRVAAVGSRGGAELLRRLHPLERFALAFTRSGVRQIRFVWVQPPRGWHAVCMTRERAPDETAGAPAAVVELEPSPAPYGLTVRELEVLTLLSGGLSNPEIAAHLGMSRRTVSTHVAHILGKLGQASRAGAAALAVDQGLLRLPVPGSGRALGMLGVGLVDQIASGLAPGRPADRGWQRVLRPRLAPIRLGALVTADGPAGDGEQVRNGSALAVVEINARGGVGGRVIELMVDPVEADDPSSFGAALRRLADRDVDGIVGGYANYLRPGDYAAVADQGCPILTAMTSAAQARWVRQDPTGLGGVFQVGPTEANYGTGTIAFLERLRAAAWQPARRRIAPVETPVDAGQPFGAAARALAERAGWTVESPLVVPLHDVDWRLVIARLAADEPGVVVLTHFVPGEAAAFQRAFVRSGLQALVYMVYAPSLPAFLHEAGAAAEGVVWATVTGTYGDELGTRFRDRYRQRFGQAPGRSLAGSAFDQVHILALAWSRVDDPHRFTDVAAELRRITHRGVNGAYDLSRGDQTGRSYPLETRDPSLGQAHLVFQVQEGAHRVLAPAPYAETGFRRPPWLERPRDRAVAAG
jgi:branched-chain amino acid transport system substrate-binding protein